MAITEEANCWIIPLSYLQNRPYFMKKISITSFFIIGLMFFLFGQEHIPVSPGLEGQPLYEAVAADFTPVIHLSYGEARDTLYGEVYRVNDSLHCIYTDWAVYMPPGADPTTVVYQNGNGLNAEHTWPQSLGAGSVPPRADMHHLFPSRADVNSDRGSLKFGEVSDNSTSRWYYLSTSLASPPAINRDAYSELLLNSSFEPREISKGNIARAIFYFNTIYRAQANSQGAGFFDSQRATLCQWHRDDPVDELEWNRTFLIASHQSDKPNPFVIDCTLAARMYCPEILDNMCAPTATKTIFESLDVKIFPNPSRKQSHIQGFAQESGLLELNYFDLQGRLVQSESLDVTQGAFELDIKLPFAGFWQCQMKLQTQEGYYVKTLPLVVLP